jgi:hypothetical protein
MGRPLACRHHYTSRKPQQLVSPTESGWFKNETKTISSSEYRALSSSMNQLTGQHDHQNDVYSEQTQTFVQIDTCNEQVIPFFSAHNEGSPKYLSATEHDIYRYSQNGTNLSFAGITMAGEDFLDMLSSPIFHQALATGIDLRDPLDPHDLGQIFNV